MVRVAFDSIDDPVTLVDLRPVTVDSLWRTVLGSVDCGSPERAIVVHPSWWTPTRLDVVGTAAQVLACEVVMRPRSWLLTQASPLESQHTAVVAEIADCFVVVTGAEVVAETRRGNLSMSFGGCAFHPRDNVRPDRGGGDRRAEHSRWCRRTGGDDRQGLQASGMIGAVKVVDDRRPEKGCRRDYPGRRQQLRVTRCGAWGAIIVVAGRLALAVLLIIAVLGALASSRHGAPAGESVPTTFLVEGRVAVEVPAQWPTQRVVAGPGSARVQVTSSSDPEMALHVTQSRIAIAALERHRRVSERGHRRRADRRIRRLQPRRQ